MAWLFLAALLAGQGGANDTASLSDHWSAAKTLANRIDAEIARRWVEARVTPVEPADDAAFLRRIYLDLCGKIPSAWEVREYIADLSPDKRQRLIDRLIASPAFASYQAAQWRKILLPEASSDPTIRILGQSLEAWLRREWLNERTFGQTTQALLTGRLSVALNRGIGAQASPAIYFSAKGGKPAELAASVSRALLGTRIECAQCHDHPFDRWKQRDFWELAAFFGQLKAAQPEAGIYSPLTETNGPAELTIPGTDTVVAPRFPDDVAPEIAATQNSRQVLADWLVSESNLRFARAAANRVWAQFFGTGIVDPVDDFSAANLPSHPELLDLLAQDLAAHQHDLRRLMRAIAISQTYGLSSQSAAAQPIDARLFHIAAVRRLSAEQIAACLVQATGRPLERAANPYADMNDPVGVVQETFVETGEPTTDAATSIIQALTLMNGGLTSEGTDLLASRTLTAAAEMPGLSPRDQIEVLYFSTLNRPPTEEELADMTRYYVEESALSATALSDIFWALLNSTEFLTNH